jgi:hypothetical protein
MSKKTQENYRLKNLCIFCGKNPPRTNRLACESCGVKQSVNAKNKRQKQLLQKICRDCGSPNLITKSHCEQCRDKHNQTTSLRYSVIKNEVFNAYGGYVCVCCGELEKAFLSIDHINNDGAEHRKNMSSGSNTYRWLRDNNFPNGFQVLCMNCQWGKKNCNGVCPHQTI